MLVYLQWLIIDKYQPGIFVWEHTSQLISEHESISRVSEKLYTQSLEYSISQILNISNTQYLEYSISQILNLSNI